MRRAMITATVLAGGLFLTGPLQAQSASLGVKGGVTIATFGGADAGGPGNEAGFVGGGFATIALGDMFAIQPEVLYANKGAKWDVPEISGTGHLKFGYIEIPVLARVNGPASAGGAFTPYAVAGPFVAFQSRCRLSAEDQSTSVSVACDDPMFEGDLAFKKTDVGVTFGLGTDVRVGRASLVLDARYDLGLTKIDDSPLEADVRNQAFMIMAGVHFLIGGGELALR